MTSCPRRVVRIAALALAAASSAVILAQSTTLRLVSTTWPPFTDDAGRPRVALDLVEAGLKRAGVGASTEIVPPAQYTAALIGGGFDGSAAAWQDATRDAALVFSQPYLENRLVLVGRRGSNVSASMLAALAGRRVAIVGGYAYGDIETSGPDFVRTASDQDSLRQLLDDRVEFALVDELVVHYIVDSHTADAEARLEIGTTALVTRPLHLALRRSRPDAEAVVGRFNAQLRAMLADGTYHRLLQVDWLLADVDGDGVLEYVPGAQRVAAQAPDHVYTLVSPADREKAGATRKPRFYLGGNVYEDWASVPNRYKTDSNTRPDSRRSTGTIFTFGW